MPEINNIVDCSDLDGKNSDDNPNFVRCESKYSDIINDGEEHPNCDDGYYIERQINIGKDDFALPNEEIIKDGVCGVPAASVDFSPPDKPLNYIELKLRFGVIDSNENGVIDSGDDLDGDNDIDEVRGDSTAWTTSPGINSADVISGDDLDIPATIPT